MFDILFMLIMWQVGMLSTFFVKIHKTLKVNICRIVTPNLLKFSFVWNFHNKKFEVLNLTSFGTLKYDCLIKAREMFSFLHLINKSVTTWLSFYYYAYQQYIFKYNQYFAFLFWVVFFHVFINILHIIWVSNKNFRIIKMLCSNIFTLFNQKLIFFFVWIVNI